MTSPNSIEKALASLLEKGFPNYLAFREDFLIPLTGLPFDPNWRVDTHPLLEQLGVTSYGILKSIHFIDIRKDQIKISDPEQSFKNIYFHFGLIFDCIESLSRIIALIEKHLKIRDLPLNLKLNTITLLFDYLKWIKTDYSKRYQEMTEMGKPILYYPHKNHSFLNNIIKNPLKRRYNKFATLIKSYRNYYIHNAGVDVFLEISTGWVFALKKEFVNESKNWSNLQFIFNIDRSFFINPKEMIGNDLNYLLSLLNEIWDPIIKRLEVIYQHPDFLKINKNYPRNIKF